MKATCDLKLKLKSLIKLEKPKKSNHHKVTQRLLKLKQKDISLEKTQQMVD